MGDADEEGKDGKRFLLLFGSQTGQAEAIAEQIRDEALSRGLKPDLHCLDKSEKKFHLEQESVFVVVVSTTGDGDPPDNVAKFWRRLKKKALPSDHLARCSYALLGLGDTNYTNFCNMGKTLNKRLLELGATQFYPPGFADDGVGLDIVVEPWIAGLWDPLLDILGASSGSEPFIRSAPSCSNSKPDSQEFTDSDDVTSKMGSISLDARDQSTVISHTQTTPLDSIVSSQSSNYACSSSISTSKTIPPAGYAPTPTSQATPHVNSSCGTESEVAMPWIRKLTTYSGRVSLSSLSLPTLPAAYIHVDLSAVSEVRDFSYSAVSYGVGTATPLISMATLKGSRVLTNQGSKKKTMELEFELPPGLEYEPGDAMAFICPNSKEEVEWLLDRLDLMKVADMSMTLSILATTTKKKALLPKHVPKGCSMRQFFTHCADIRSVPKKAHLHLWSTFCSNEKESARLKELSSKQGASEYSLLFTEGRTEFLDVLHAFPSLLPPLQRLIEVLPRLQPRYYSAASSSSFSPGRLKIAFNVEKLPDRQWSSNRKGVGLERERCGLATGWLEQLAATYGCDEVDKTLKVPFFPRALNSFHLPKDTSVPIIMVGPGTGVAPFVGFLRHREFLLKGARSNVSEDLTLLPDGSGDCCSSDKDPSKPLNKVQDSLSSINPRSLHIDHSIRDPSISVKDHSIRDPSISVKDHSIRDPSISVKDQSSSSHDPSVFIEASTHQNPLLSLIQDPSTSAIPESGTAPLGRAMVQDLSNLASSGSITTSLGRTWLFFGCRNPRTDHIFKEEMDHFRAFGVLNRLDIAYSQPTSPDNEATPTTLSAAPPSPPQGCYVQDLMMKNWRELGELLVKDRGHVYVCGDAKHMARDVHSALVTILEKYLFSDESHDGVLPPEEMLKALKEEGRYLVDAWS